MALMICCIQLNKESIGIQEFERFLGPTGLRFQIARRQFCCYLIGVETGHSEVVVV